MTYAKRTWVTGEKWGAAAANDVETRIDNEFAVLRESPISITDARFAGGADKTGATSSTAALNAIIASLGTYGAEIVAPPGLYDFATIPVINKNNVTIRGLGGPEFRVEKLTVQADNFKVTDVNFRERAGTPAGNGRAIYVDPDGAGRALAGFTINDCDFFDLFYAVDFRGSATNGVSKIRMSNCFSTRVAAGNAGHFNFFYPTDVTTMGLGTYGGANAASQNFFGGGGAITVIGGADKDNDVSGGALSFENFFASAKVTVLGGSWGWGIPSGIDAYALTVDDVEDVTIVGADFGGYVRVQTTTGVVRRCHIADSYMTRFRLASGAGSPQYVDELDLANCTLRGVPGSVNTLTAINIDGTYLRKARIVDSTVKRFAADGTSENWANAMLLSRSANLNAEVDRNDFGARPITASSTGGIIRFGQDNVNYGTLTGITRAPAATPVKAGIPADADYDIPLLSGQGPVIDSTNNRVYFRVGATWKFAALT